MKSEKGGNFKQRKYYEMKRKGGLNSQGPRALERRGKARKTPRSPILMKRFLLAKTRQIVRTESRHHVKWRKASNHGTGGKESRQSKPGQGKTSEKKKGKPHRMGKIRLAYEEREPGVRPEQTRGILTIFFYQNEN